MADIDVVIPNYNYGRYLRACVASVTSQCGVDIRIVIIDNASTDDSVAIAQSLAAEDERISVVVHARNMGPQASFNEAIDVATAPYMMILCADDRLTTGALSRAKTVMDAYPHVVFAHGVEIEVADEDAGPASANVRGKARWEVDRGLHFIAARCRTPTATVAAGTVLVRTAIQKAVGHFDARLRYVDDLEMLLRLAAHGDVARIDTAQGLRRLHDANMSEGYARDPSYSLVERFDAFRFALAHANAIGCDTGGCLDTARINLCGAAYWGGIRRLLHADVRGARAHLEAAFRISPLSAVAPPLGYALRAWSRRMRRAA